MRAVPQDTDLKFCPWELTKLQNTIYKLQSPSNTEESTEEQAGQELTAKVQLINKLPEQESSYDLTLWTIQVAEIRHCIDDIIQDKGTEFTSKPSVTVPLLEQEDT